MERNRILEILKSAYRWGVDYGSNRSDKNFSDFLETSQAKELFNLVPQEQRECQCDPDIIGSYTRCPIHSPDNDLREEIGTEDFYDD
jgi:hypothetical protein